MGHEPITDEDSATDDSHRLATDRNRNRIRHLESKVELPFSRTLPSRDLLSHERNGNLASRSPAQ